MDNQKYLYSHLSAVENQQDDGVEDGGSCSHGKPIPYIKRPKSIALHLLLLILYTISVITVSRLFRGQKIPIQHHRLVYSPANEAVEYTTRRYHNGPWITSPFIGDPRPELDKAWHELLKNTNMRISKEVLEKVNRTSLPLGIGGGFFGELTVFHELHCLKFIHHAMRPEAYHEYYGEAEREHLVQHVDHCLETLRESIMCRGDTTLLTFSFVDDIRLPQADLTLEHECVNWDKLNGWAGQHAVNLFEEGMLTHPILGPSYPGGHRADRPLPPS